MCLLLLERKREKGREGEKGRGRERQGEGGGEREGEGGRKEYECERETSIAIS